MTTPNDIISRALKDIGALEAGETPTAEASQDAFDMLQDMLDQWSNEDMMVFYKNEIIFNVTPGQTQYTIGPGGQIGAVFTGYIQNNILTVTQLTSGGISINQTMTGLNLPSGTTITQMLSGAGGQVNELGTYLLNTTIVNPTPTFTASVSGTTLNVSAISQGTLGVGCVITGTGITAGTTITALGSGTGGTGSYTISNNLGTISSEAMTATPIPVNYNSYYQRPLGLRSAFVRVNTTSNGAPITGGGLDYPVAVLNLEQYEMIGLKTLNGPWPKAVYYEPTETLGNIYLWPNPSQGQMHIFVDQIFSRFTTMFDNINLPQGYNMALRWCLAERLMPMYGKASPTQIQMIMKFAAQGKSTVKRTNMNPAITSTYADALLVGRQKDAGWILSGGFFR